jgi:hypothetical protein
VSAIRPEWSSLSGGNRLPSMRILGRAQAQVNVDSRFTFRFGRHVEIREGLAALGE